VRNHSFLVVLALALVMVLAPHAPSRAQEATTRTLSFATLAPPGSMIMRGLEAWNRELRRRTNRGLQFRFYAGGVQGDEPEVIRKIRSGRLDAGGVTSTGLAQIHRPALIFQLPATFRTYAQIEAARAALAPEIEAGMRTQGFRMLGWADVGQAHLFSTREVHRPADLAQCHFWVRTDDILLPALFEIVPSHPVSMSVPEVLGGLQTHRIDTFLAPPVVATALQWGAHATYMGETPVAILVGGTVLSEPVFQSLPADQQAILTETGTQFHQLARRNADRAEREAIAALVARGLRIVPTSPEDLAEWRRIGAQVRERVAPQIADPALVARAASFGEQQ
jgi:TRAP-type C4-dicarboxylate transport system substrate-binding protein